MSVAVTIVLKNTLSFKKNDLFSYYFINIKKSLFFNNYNINKFHKNIQTNY